MKQIKRLAVLLLVVCCLFLTGCRGGQDFINNVSKQLQAGGREYGQSYTAEEGEALKNQFFEYQIQSAKLVAELPDGSTVEEEGDLILVVEVKVKNVFDGEIPMSNADFELAYDGMTDDYDALPLEEGFLDDQLPDEWSMDTGETSEGALLFVVPSSVHDFRLSYLELWDDDFEGNTYTIPFSAVEGGLEADL